MTTRVAQLRNFRRAWSCDQGQTMAEYGVVLAVVTLIVLGSLLTLSGAINAAVILIAGIF